MMRGVVQTHERPSAGAAAPLEGRQERGAPVTVIYGGPLAMGTGSFIGVAAKVYTSM